MSTSRLRFFLLFHSRMNSYGAKSATEGASVAAINNAEVASRHSISHVRLHPLHDAEVSLTLDGRHGQRCNNGQKLMRYRAAFAQEAVG